MIYFDHNSTTPLAQGVLESMIPWFETQFGNPSSKHRLGREAAKAVDLSRTQLATLLGVEFSHVVFTSSATESNNAVLYSIASQGSRPKHIITCSTEHSSILTCCNRLQTQGILEVTVLPVDSQGLIDLDELKNSFRPDTALVTLMTANNETGVLLPVSEIAEICSAREIKFHTDAVQALGKINSSLYNTADFISLSGHKIGAPKGIGALVCNPDSFKPLLTGGKQENGLRAGTEAVPLIVGFGVAAEHAAKVPICGIANLRDGFERKLREAIKGVSIHGVQAPRLPNTSNIHLPGLDSDALVRYLDQKGICVSSGSACMEGAISPSHVICAMTQSHEVANESIRVSLGARNSEEDINTLVNEIVNFHQMMV